MHEYVPGCTLRANGILPLVDCGLLAGLINVKLVKKWMICSLTGAVSSEIVSKVRKIMASSGRRELIMSVMAKACLTAKSTDCAGVVFIFFQKVFIFDSLGLFVTAVIPADQFLPAGV